VKTTGPDSEEVETRGSGAKRRLPEKRLPLEDQKSAAGYTINKSLESEMEIRV
jgi:hypothetical protein